MLLAACRRLLDAGKLLCRSLAFPLVRTLLPAPRGALEGKGPQRRPQRRLDRRLEEDAKAVGGGYCRL